MWLYDENGYLIFVKLSDIEKCKMCGMSYKRDVIIKPFSNKVSHDECPHCNNRLCSSESIEFMNTIIRKAVG